MLKRFETILLSEAMEFLRNQDQKARNKILQIIERASQSTDPKLLKKLEGEIWEFRILYSGLQYRMLAFWDKTDKRGTLVLATHGFIKKTSKVDKKELVRAERIRLKYFKDKKS